MREDPRSTAAEAKSGREIGTETTADISTTRDEAHHETETRDGIRSITETPETEIETESKSETQSANPLSPNQQLQLNQSQSIPPSPNPKPTQNAEQ